MLGGVCAPRVDGRALEGRLAAARRQRSVRRHDADVRALVVRLDLRVERLQELVAPRGPLGGEEQARGRVERDPRDEMSVFARQGGRFEFETERERSISKKKGARGGPGSYLAVAVAASKK